VIDELKLDVEHAEAIVEKGIEFEVYTDPMPDTDKDKVEAAHEIVSFAIDAWVNDEVRPDSDNEKVASAGAQIVEIFEYAGITATSKGKITFGELPEFEGGEEDEDAEGDGEAAFDVDDTIEDYSEMNGKQRLAAVQEVMSDDGEGLYEEQVKGLLEYENEQEKPNAKLVEFLEGVIDDSDDDEDAEGDEDDDTTAEGDGDEEEGGEPYEGYDKATVAEIKEALTEAAQDEDDPLEAGQLEYVIEYEEANKKRATFVKWLKKMLDEMGEGDDDGEAEAEEEKPAAKKTTKKTTVSTNGSSSITLTRDQILAALSEGEVTIEV